MLIYEKNNKLNINFDPSKSIEGTPDIQIGENEIKLGDAEITSENVLPTPTNEDVGKVPTVQEDGMYSLENIPSELPVATPEDEGKVVTVSQDGSYELAEDSGGAIICIIDTSNGNVLSMTHDEIAKALRDQKEVVFVQYVESPTRPISGQSNLISEIRESGTYKGIAVTFIGTYQDVDSAASLTEMNVTIYRILRDDTVSAISKKISFS